MGLPLEVASEKEEFKNALRKFQDRDVILVDTPGAASATRRTWTAERLSPPGDPRGDESPDQHDGKSREHAGDDVALRQGRIRGHYLHEAR